MNELQFTLTLLEPVHLATTGQRRIVVLEPVHRANGFILTAAHPGA